ncbi:MAG: hypothetical protein FJ104_15905, partial [Deltaproteobacteria bacterium]|nr:hypothetical protein [Deltaproteobacteria bacterium]
LLPHAFPTVGAYASGVLYATRDRATEALPRGATYHVAVSGSAEVPPLALQVEAPDAPAEPRVDGADLRELGSLRGGRPLEVEWTPGDPSDLVFVELLSLDGQLNLVCSFPDEAGAGTVPAITGPASGAARIALHRVRTRRFAEGAARVSEVRFDFSVGRTVDLSR